MPWFIMYTPVASSRLMLHTPESLRKEKKPRHAPDHRLLTFQYRLWSLANLSQRCRSPRCCTKSCKRMVLTRKSLHNILQSGKRWDPPLSMQIFTLEKMVITTSPDVQGDLCCGMFTCHQPTIRRELHGGRWQPSGKAKKPVTRLSSMRLPPAWFFADRYCQRANRPPYCHDPRFLS